MLNILQATNAGVRRPGYEAKIMVLEIHIFFYYFVGTCMLVELTTMTVMSFSLLVLLHRFEWAVLSLMCAYMVKGSL